MASIKTPLGDAPVIPVLMVMLGAYLAWFGVHYFRGDQAWPSDPIKSVLTTAKITPVTHAEENDRNASIQAYVAPSGNSIDNGQTGSTIADDALSYVGQGYVFGGKADRPGNWDCSSFTSYVLGHDLSLALPGGHWGDPGFPPHSHGPTTGSYALYGMQIDGGQVVAGDLVVWSTHMGIATSNTEIVSARDEQEGVGVSTIAGTTASLGESVRYRRVPGNISSGGTSGVRVQ
jgi:cell wall-associated NlpC family hydrolase